LRAQLTSGSLRLLFSRPVPAPESVLEAIEARFDRSVEELVALTRIPSVSAPGFDPHEVVRSAEQVASLLESAGLEQVELQRIGSAHPYVVASHCRAGREVPTLLLYAHHDVQPPGRLDRWKTPPFEPVVRGDGRLYGRGIVDDKAGILVHAAAIRAWLETQGGLPVNVKLLVEGEEEIGSSHLSDFLRAHRERLDADLLVLSDTSNLATGLPSLTTSLRGLVSVDVTVRALDHPLHSGIWGGPVPDAATALAVLLARLVDERGVIAIPDFYEDVPEWDAEERARLAALPFDEAVFRRDAGMAAGAPFAGEPQYSVYERLWTRPALAITALEAVPLAEAANQLIAEARARIGLRLAPGQDADLACRRLVDFLKRDTPLGVVVEIHVGAAVAGWRTQPEGPAFDAARRALTAGYACEPVAIGCGGTIPFVAPFVSVLGGVPALLLGLEDPPCNAHGENESLDLQDFGNAVRSAAHLLAELADPALRR